MTQRLSTLELTTIAAASPSLAEILRLCALRAGLSRLATTRPLVLGNPKAWLGTAYHEVLKAAGSIAGGGIEAAAEAVWDRAIQRQHEQAQAHPLNSRFGAPERWPGYHLIRAMAVMRARELASDASATLASASEPRSNTAIERGRSREEWLTALEERLVGRPDVVRDDAVIDFKTGDIYEHGEDGVVKASYVRQLHIYAYLVKECTGRWPARGVLLPMEGSPVEVSLDPDECERTAVEALQMLDAYNAHVEAGDSAMELASPSPETCRWCSYQLVCPAFWAASDDTWAEQDGPAALGGVASATPHSIYGGSALALSVRVDDGTEPQHVIDLAPLTANTHPALQFVHEGTRIRAAGLYRRADGTLSPGLRTVIARVCDLPTVVVAAEATESGGKYY